MATPARGALSWRRPLIALLGAIGVCYVVVPILLAIGLFYLSLTLGAEQGDDGAFRFLFLAGGAIVVVKGMQALLLLAFYPVLLFLVRGLGELRPLSDCLVAVIVVMLIGMLLQYPAITLGVEMAWIAAFAGFYWRLAGRPRPPYA